MHLQPKLFLTYSILIFCVIAWGSNFVIGKILIDYFHPYTITLVRLIAINLFLWLFLYRYFNFQNIPKKIWVGLAFSGLVGIALNRYTFFLGLVTASPVTSALILALAPITLSFLSFIFFIVTSSCDFWVSGLII